MLNLVSTQPRIVRCRSNSVQFDDVTADTLQTFKVNRQSVKSHLVSAVKRYKSETGMIDIDLILSVSQCRAQHVAHVQRH